MMESLERSLSFDMYNRMEELLNDNSISFEDKKERVLESFALIAIHSDRLEQKNVEYEGEIRRLEHNIYILKNEMFPMRKTRKGS